VTIRRLAFAILAAAIAGSLLPAGPALAPLPGQVTGLSVAQGDGFATPSWSPVAAATDTQIEPTPAPQSVL
jgi:hypothetical protein